MGFAAVVKRGNGGKMPYRACGKGTREMLLPQRHRIAGFAAVVERGNGGKMPHRACGKGTWRKQPPQRHRITGFAAVVERRTDNVAGRSRHK